MSTTKKLSSSSKLPLSISSRCNRPFMAFWTIERPALPPIEVGASSCVTGKSSRSLDFRSLISESTSIMFFWFFLGRIHEGRTRTNTRWRERPFAMNTANTTFTKLLRFRVRCKKALTLDHFSDEKKNILARKLSMTNCGLDMICVWSGNALLFGHRRPKLIVHTNT